MHRGLTHDGIREVVTRTPEQRVFDSKQDFSRPTDERAKGEVVKDITAVAMGQPSLEPPGLIVYGVDRRRPDPIVGICISESYDDASPSSFCEARSAIPWTSSTTR